MVGKDVRSIKGYPAPDCDKQEDCKRRVSAVKTCRQFHRSDDDDDVFVSTEDEKEEVNLKPSRGVPQPSPG